MSTAVFTYHNPSARLIASLTESVKRAQTVFGHLKSLYFLPIQARIDFYFGVSILPSVTYGMLVWGSCGQAFFSNLEFIHVRAANIIFNLDWCTPSKEVLAVAKWNTLETMYEKRLLILAHQAYIIFYHVL